MSTPDRPATADAAGVRELADAAGIRRVHVLAWRDLDDVEAGGSERHAHEVCRAWAAAGLDVTCRTSFAQDHPPETVRDGYRVVRRAGRYLIFPRAVGGELRGHHGRRDALVEIWNGMPFFTPLWARGPRLVLLHHVHGEMWHMVLPPRLARAGDLLERRIAPLLYRRSSVATLSDSSRDQILREMRLRPDRVAVVPPGIDPVFTPPPGEPTTRDAHRAPELVTVGRLVPPKRHAELVRQVARVRESVPGVRLTVVGGGYERAAVEAAIDEVGGKGWVDLVGHVSTDELVEHYRRATLLVSASSHEGWGMSITEAAACGTPAVVTDIAGHRDAVDPGVTGVLAPTVDDLAPAITGLLVDDQRRAAMADAALDRSARYRWSTTATSLMALLAAQS